MIKHRCKNLMMKIHHRNRQKYKKNLLPELPNGDTIKQLFATSRDLLYIKHDSRTRNQQRRAGLAILKISQYGKSI